MCNINIDKTIAKVRKHLYKYTSDIKMCEESSGGMKRNKRIKKETKSIKSFMEIVDLLRFGVE